MVETNLIGRKVTGAWLDGQIGTIVAVWSVWAFFGRTLFFLVESPSGNIRESLAEGFFMLPDSGKG